VNNHAVSKYWEFAVALSVELKVRLYMKRSKVYFAPLPEASLPEQMAEAAGLIWAKMGLKRIVIKGGFVAIKQHFGEAKGKGYLAPPVARAIGEKIKAAGGKPFLTDTNTLYRGRRSNACDHLEIAREHGFSHDQLGFPVIIADGLKGESQVKTQLAGCRLKYAFLAGAGLFADAAIVLTHVTGHIVAGLGASIKNTGMGFAGRGGKLHQHHGSAPVFLEKKCVACGICARHCPANAISIGKYAVLDPQKCIGCGECFAYCRSGAITFKWAVQSQALQEKMTEYCLAFHRTKKGHIAYFNFLTRISKDCDCMTTNSIMLPDVGVVGSLDPVAADAAAMDLVNQRFGRDIFKEFWPKIDARVQLRYGETIGLGSTGYTLIRIMTRKRFSATR
jgi:hypothetical protein